MKTHKIHISKKTSYKLSALVINSLCAKGEQKNKIAEILGVKPPFVSNVSKAKKKLSLYHLLKLAESYGQYLPTFLEAHLPKPKVSEDDKAKKIDKNIRESLNLSSKAKELLSKAKQE